MEINTHEILRQRAKQAQEDAMLKFNVSAEELAALKMNIVQFAGLSHMGQAIARTAAAAKIAADNAAKIAADNAAKMETKETIKNEVKK